MWRNGCRDVKENIWDSKSEGFEEDHTQKTQESQEQTNVDGIFSPSLKAPLNCSRVSSVAGSVGPSCGHESVVDADNIPPLSQTIHQNEHEVNQVESQASTKQAQEVEKQQQQEEEELVTDAQDHTQEEEEEEEEEESAPHSFNPFFFMKMLPNYEEIVETPREIVLPAKSRYTPNICLVLDLDETLVHCTVEEVDNPDLKFPIHFNGIEYVVNVRKRPHMEYFLERVSQLFEVVVFTASQRIYAEKLLNLLDPHREWIKYRLFREDCLPVEGNFLKDLSILGRCLSKVLLVDNSPHAFGYQVNNGIPIESWFHDDSDEELLNLLTFLENIHDVDDVRPIVEKQFQIQKLIDNATIEEILLAEEKEKEKNPVQQDQEDPVTYDELERELEREIHVA
jgi:CTD small phosphatase-like protein 2